MDTPKVTALAPWFGSNRSLAHRVGELLDGCKWVGVPFAGGMSELLHITAPTVLVSDLHRHVLNLAAVVANELDCPRLVRMLDALPYHPDVLAAAQARCAEREAAADADWFGGGPQPLPCDLLWARDYFVSAWMSRNGSAGTRGEFAAPLSVRWCAGGGDSAQRFRSATDSLAAWSAVMRRCTFVRCDVFKFVPDAPDLPRHGLYLDPPFPDAGDGYKHGFTTEDQRRLSRLLARFERTRVVVRYYDHPLIRELYAGWHWEHPEGGKTQTNQAAPEVLLTNFEV